MTGHSDWAARTAAEYAAGRPLALLFDYGGTLAPTAPEPGLAVLPEVTRDLLAALAGIDRVAVGVLSGRAIGHLKELVGVHGLLYAGSGGMQLDLGGEDVTDPAAAEFDRLADAVVNAVAEPVRWFPGTWVERKPGCLAVHYRVLGPLKAACFRDEVQTVLADLAADAPPLHVCDREAALCVCLAGAWTRADAIDRMLGGRGAFAVYAGDGAGDAEAVERVNARGGLTVGVGPNPPPGVRARVASPAALADDLGRLFALLNPGAVRVPRLVQSMCS